MFGGGIRQKWRFLVNTTLSGGSLCKLRVDGFAVVVFMWKQSAQMRKTLHFICLGEYVVYIELWSGVEWCGRIYIECVCSGYDALYCHSLDVFKMKFGKLFCLNNFNVGKSI